MRSPIFTPYQLALALSILQMREEFPAVAASLERALRQSLGQTALRP